MSNQVRNVKKSAFSCDQCRRRKVKCDGVQPVCNRCKTRTESCLYKLSPTLSYTQRLENRVAELESMLAKMTPTSGAMHETPSQDSITGSQSQNTTPRPRTDRTTSFKGSTSLFELGESASDPAAEKSHETHENALNKANLVNSAWRERAYEKLAITPEPFRYLLDSHWCWIQPLFNFVYRPAFTRDMTSGGPYFSSTLMNAMLSHSIRWCKSEPGMEQLLVPFDGGNTFFQDAVTSILTDVRHGQSKVPTVQSLLLLSAQECGRGNRTQAWLYSGMAFRLIDDMGMCVDGRRHKQSESYNVEDIEIRNRLFWSCFFWDKMVALYFGRTPILQNSHISPPRVLMDDTAESELWTPHGLSSVNYPPMKAHSISCFIHMCALAEILNQVLIHLYSPASDPSSSNALRCAVEEATKIRNWWKDLPEHLKVNVASLPVFCPPSHIVTLNCLYHTVNILLHRALLRLNREHHTNETAEQNPLIQCIASATSIVALFDLFVRTFGDGHVILSLAYSVYTAASIFLLELQAGNHTQTGTLERLKYCLGALEKVQRTNPVIATTLISIYKELDVLGLDLRSDDSRAIGKSSWRSVTPGASTAPSIRNDYTFTSPQSHTDSGTNSLHQQAAEVTDSSYLDSEFAGILDYNLLDMPADIFDAFTRVEPLSTTMDPGFDLY